MICGLLHEAGHAVQPSSVFTTLRRSKKRDVAIIIEQEYKAWESGWDIARVCNICTDSLHAEYIRSWMHSWSRYIQQISEHADNAEYIARVQSGYKLRQT